MREQSRAKASRLADKPQSFSVDISVLNKLQTADRERCIYSSMEQNSEHIQVLLFV